MMALVPKIISVEQGAFLPGRNIYESITLTREMVHLLDRKIRGGNVMVKVDMAKAYDRVDWQFLVHFLGSFGFPVKFCSLIMECVSTPWFSIIINGTTRSFFKLSRELRQGDPISPYLFIIKEEDSTRLTRKQFEEGHIVTFSHPVKLLWCLSYLLYHVCR